MCAAFARTAAALPVAALLAAAPASAQDTVVVGGPDAGGNNNVSVNLDALNDGGRSRDRQGVSRGGQTGTGGTAGEGQRQFDLRGGDVAEQARRVEPGEVVRGPGGARLRFPLLEPPRSRLTVDMAEFAPKRPDKAPSEQRDQQTGDAPVASADGAGGGEPREFDVGEQGAAPADRETETAATFDAGQRDTGGQQGSASQPAGEMDAGGGGTTQMTDSAGTGTTASESTGGGAGMETAASGDGMDAGETGNTEPDSAGTGTTETASAETGTGEPETGAGDRDTGGSAGGDATAGGDDDPVALQPSGSKPSGELDTQTASAETQPADAATESGSGTGETADPAATDAGGDSTSGSAGDGQGEAGDTQTAARTAESGSGDRTMLRFGGDSAELSDAAKGKLDAVVKRLKSSDSARIELTAYAEAPGGSASRSRRLSLSRALAVRSYLIEQGVRSTRIDVRALGDAAESEPVDRVDIAPASSS